MADIQEYSGHSLQGLQEAAKLPWREFAEWADPRLPEAEGTLQNRRAENPQLGEFTHGYHSPCIMISERSRSRYGDWRHLALRILWEALRRFGCINWLGLFEMAIGRPLEDTAASGSGRYIAGRRTVFQQVDEFVSAVYERIDALDAVLKEIIYAARRGEGPDGDLWPEYSSTARFFWKAGRSSPPRHRFELERLPEVRLARWVLRGPFNHERAFWLQARDGVRTELPAFVSAEKAIREGRPPGRKERAALIKYTSLGTVVPRWRREGVGESVEVVMEPHWQDVHADAVGQRVHALLIPIAYHLSLAWADSQTWPRFVVTCRNPLCGQRFYSGRADAKACPRPKGGARRSPCKAVWEAYQKWLIKVGYDPDRSWRDRELRRRFKAIYIPRGPQSRPG